MNSTEQQEQQQQKQKAIKYRLMFSGDIHLSSKNYGGHTDYAKESMYYFKMLNDISEENGVTHDIRLGDFTYSNFTDLSYRIEVEKELDRAMELTNNNLYILKGNHDVSAKGMTEYEFYKSKGRFKGSEHLNLGSVRVNMVNNGESKDTPIIAPTGNTLDIVVGHDYYKFKDTQLPNYGDAILLDNKKEWYGVDLCLLGHIHTSHTFKGGIIKDGYSYPTIVKYLNCPCRTSYTDDLATEWDIVFLDIYEDGSYALTEHKADLLPISECFDIEKIANEKKAKEQSHIDMTDIIDRVGKYKTNIGDPEQIIRNMQDVDERYKEKALELLKE